MAAQGKQSFENHIRYDGMSIGIGIATAAVLLIALVGMAFSQLVLNICVPLLAALVLFTNLKARIYGITVQDRVIRLEMQLRLERVLPEELKPRISELSTKQLTALRFASDEELPEMVRSVLDGKLANGTEIKKAVKHWQADFLRV